MFLRWIASQFRCPSGFWGVTRDITEAIIAMGRTLSLTVIAEGVETIEQMNFLSDHACDEMQGFYFSKPIIPEQFADLLREHVPSRQK